MTSLQHIALHLIPALSALGLAWSAIPSRRSTEDADEIERGSTTIMPEDR